MNLKPCPFCGGEATGFWSTSKMVCSNYVVGCDKCDIWVRKTDEAKAIAIWNKRADQPLIQTLYILLRRSALIDASRAIRPEVGDMVIESSRFAPDSSMIGRLDKIEGDEFLVTSLDGEKQRWKNSEARTVSLL